MKFYEQRTKGGTNKTNKREMGGRKGKGGEGGRGKGERQKQRKTKTQTNKSRRATKKRVKKLLPIRSCDT